MNVAQYADEDWKLPHSATVQRSTRGGSSKALSRHIRSTLTNRIAIERLAHTGDVPAGVTYRGDEVARAADIYAAAFPDMHHGLSDLYFDGESSSFSCR